MGFSRQEYWSGVPLPSPDEILEHRNFIKTEVPNTVEAVGDLKNTKAFALL